MNESTRSNDYVASSTVMKEVFERARSLAAVDNANVLITGETGTGKTLVAKHIFDSSSCSGKFVPLNCSLFTADLLRSELFGHVKGAFTGADSAMEGKCHLAQFGVLFLDEIGDMDLAAQPQVLTFLEDKKFFRVRGNREETADLRIVAATNVDLDGAVEQERFRQDLKNRFDHVIEVPPLRTRREDIPSLLRYFWKKFCADYHFDPGDPEIDAIDREFQIADYDWPDNARGLRSMVKEAMLSSSPDPKRFPVCLQAQLHEKMRRETNSLRPRIEEELASHMCKRLSLLFTQNDKGSGLDGYMQEIMGKALADALEQLMKSGVCQSRLISATSWGKILGHGTLGGGGTGTGNDPLSNKKSSRYWYVRSALVELFEQYRGSEQLEGFWGKGLLDIVGNHVSSHMDPKGAFSEPD